MSGELLQHPVSDLHGHLQPRLVAEGDHVYFVVSYSGVATLGCYDLARDMWCGDVNFVVGNPYGVDTEPASTSPASSVVDFDVRAGTVATCESSMVVPGNILVRSNARGILNVIRTNHWLTSDMLGTTRLVGYQYPDGYPTTNPGRVVRGDIVFPPGFRQRSQRAARDFGRSTRTARAGLIFQIRGGPFAHTGEIFSADAWTLTSTGAALARFNYRGSSGSGSDVSEHAVDVEGQVEDLLFALESLLGSRPDLDPDRVAVVASSWGATLAVDLAARHKVAAMVLQRPQLNQVLRQWGSDDVTPLHHARPAAVPHQLLDQSAIQAITRAPTARLPPTLIQVGTDDVRAPDVHGHELFAALRRRGVPVVLSEYAIHHDIYGAGDPELASAYLGEATGWIAAALALAPPRGSIPPVSYGTARIRQWRRQHTRSFSARPLRGSR